MQLNRTGICEGPLDHRVKQPPKSWSRQATGRVSFSCLFKYVAYRSNLSFCQF